MLIVAKEEQRRQIPNEARCSRACHVSLGSKLTGPVEGRCTTTTCLALADSTSPGHRALLEQRGLELKDKELRAPPLGCWLPATVPCGSCPPQRPAKPATIYCVTRYR